MPKYKKIYLFLTSIFVLFLIGRIVWAACVPGDHNVRGWGWNPYVGWISLSCANEEAPSGVDFGIDVNVGTGEVTGYAWNGWGSSPGEGYWVCFGGTCDFGIHGNSPDGVPAVANYNSETDQITGWAKFIGWGDDGWIKLSADDLSWGTKFFETEGQGTFGEESAAPGSNWAWNSKIGWIKWQPTILECICTEWENIECGDPPDPLIGDDCDFHQTYQERNCNPPGCLEESRCFAFYESDYCSDGKDNDCDGCIDNVDSDCWGKETDCGDGNCCDNDKDDDCDGFTDCWEGFEDLDCDCGELSPDTPENLEATSERCGVIDLSWISEVGSYNIYKTLSANGCDDLEAETCYKIASGIVETIYSDTAVIPRINYYYRVTSVKSVEVEIGDPPETVTQEIESGPSNYDSTRTVCFPGSEWEER